VKFTINDSIITEIFSLLKETYCSPYANVETKWSKIRDPPELHEVPDF
jgi:hypothetical protein